MEQKSEAVNGATFFLSERERERERERGGERERERERERENTIKRTISTSLLFRYVNSNFKRK